MLLNDEKKIDTGTDIDNLFYLDSALKGDSDRLIQLNKVAKVKLLIHLLNNVTKIAIWIVFRLR